MKPFNYSCPSKIEDAMTGAQSASSSFIAGGTTIVDMMKLNILSPDNLIDINKIGFNKIEKRGNSVFIGALVSNTDIANNKIIKAEFPVLSESILSGASAQLRNMATAAGNVMQKTRCQYYRDNVFACNKRTPGSGCAAIAGFNRMNAILGGSDSCVAVHASDMCVALVALDAIIHTKGPNGERKIPIEEFYLLPGNTPDKENVLKQAEVITEIELPQKPFAKKSHYIKVRDRASYAFALSSAAVALELEGGKIKSCRLALGGIATKPWRAREAEKVLIGNAPSMALFQKAAQAALTGAKPLKFNAFKIELSKRSIVRALKTTGGLA